MAVIDHIPSLEVTVTIGDDMETTKEYQDPHAAERSPPTLSDFHRATDPSKIPRIIKYIEAKPGEPFGIHVELQHNFKFGRSHHTAYEFKSDAFHTRPRHQEERPTRIKPWVDGTNSTWSGNPIDGYKEHNWRFAKLDISTSFSVFSEFNYNIS